VPVRQPITRAVYTSEQNMWRVVKEFDIVPAAIRSSAISVVSRRGELVASPAAFPTNMYPNATHVQIFYSAVTYC